MKFERENTKPIKGPSAKQLSSSLKHLKGSKRSFAILSSNDENFIQMTGGGYSCILEISIDGELFRASQEKAMVPWAETTTLHTSCGEFKVEPKEYFNVQQVTDAFVKFLAGDRTHEKYKWKRVKFKT